MLGDGDADAPAVALGDAPGLSNATSSILAADASGMASGTLMDLCSTSSNNLARSKSICVAMFSTFLVNHNGGGWICSSGPYSHDWPIGFGRCSQPAECRCGMRSWARLLEAVARPWARTRTLFYPASSFGLHFGNVRVWSYRLPPRWDISRRTRSNVPPSPKRSSTMWRYRSEQRSSSR